MELKVPFLADRQLESAATELRGRSAALITAAVRAARGVRR
jgi:hypothetical protein